MIWIRAKLEQTSDSHIRAQDLCTGGGGGLSFVLNNDLQGVRKTYNTQTLLVILQGIFITKNVSCRLLKSK